MWPWLNETLNEFRKVFNNRRAFGWFVIVVIGLMLRTDTLGVTSIIRALNLNSSAYPLLLHFFRADSYTLLRLEYVWQTIVAQLPLLYHVNGMVVIVADAVKQSKEGRKMPGVKRLHQESENSAKGEYIYGHMFGGVGVILGHIRQKMYCVLVSLRIHDGVGVVNSWDKDESYSDGDKTYNEGSYIVKIIKDAIRASRVFGPCLLLLDRAYLSVPMLKVLSAQSLVRVVTKAKLNAKAYYLPKPRNGRRGASNKKGKDVKVVQLFESMAALFVTAKAQLYGKLEEVRYYNVNLQWGKKWYQELQFVLVWLNGTKTILVSTDLTLTPIQIIELYAHRFKIECSFRELKQVIAGFCYRFWSKYMPKLNRFRTNDFHQEQQEAITDNNERKCILGTLRAMESFALISCIALGLLQIISLLFTNIFTNNVVRFMRTTSNAVPSEATIADYMRKTFYRAFRLFPDLAITDIINTHQAKPYPSCDMWSA